MTDDGELFFDILSDRERKLLSHLVAYSSWCVQECWDAIACDRCPKALALANRLLHCVRCIHSIIGEVEDPIDVNEDMSDSEIKWSPGTLPVSAEFSLPPKATVSSFIKRWYPPDSHDEMERGLNDLRELTDILFARLLPVTVRRLRGGRPQVVTDAALAFELSRELEHIEYHLETDLIDTCTEAPSWESL